jgi:hypothetical protein
MVYSTQNYWVFGLFSSSGVLGSRNTFRKLDLLPSSGEEGRRLPRTPEDEKSPKTQ